MNFDNKNIVEKSTKAIVTNQMPKKNNNLAVTSLVLGIMSVVLCWVFFCPIVIGLIGIIIGLISIFQNRNGLKMSIAGIVLSVIGLLFGTLFLVIYVIGMSRIY